MAGNRFSGSSYENLMKSYENQTPSMHPSVLQSNFTPPQLCTERWTTKFYNPLLKLSHLDALLEIKRYKSSKNPALKDDGMQSQPLTLASQPHFSSRQITMLTYEQIY